MPKSSRRRHRNVTITEEDIDLPDTAETHTTVAEAFAAKEEVDSILGHPDPTVQKPAVSRKRGGIIHRDLDIIAAVPANSGPTRSSLESSESAQDDLKTPDTSAKKKKKKNQVCIVNMLSK